MMKYKVISAGMGPAEVGGEQSGSSRFENFRLCFELLIKHHLSLFTAIRGQITPAFQSEAFHRDLLFIIFDLQQH